MDQTTIQQRIDRLAKPPGSLGKLEQLAFRIASIQQTVAIQTKPRRCVIFAADHGVVESGVSSWPSSVTKSVVQLMLQGKAASTCFAKTFAVDMQIVDVGMQQPFPHDQANYHQAAIAAGTHNLAHRPAMTLEQFHQAWSIGVAHAKAAKAAGFAVLLGGEMGIGNSTAAACLAVQLAGLTVELAVGPGAGADETTMKRKRAAVRRALTIAGSQPDPIHTIAAISGFEIVALAGMYAQAAQEQLTIVLDGYIATAALLIAETLHPGTKNKVLAAHQSAEPGHASILQFLQLQPYLTDWGLRLGEATGALLLLPLMDAAATMMNGMATLNDLA